MSISCGAVSGIALLNSFVAFSKLFASNSLWHVFFFSFRFSSASHPLFESPPGMWKLSVFRKKNPEFAEKIHIDGVKDAGKLNDHLYRGTQPNEHGLRALKKLGVTMIVDLRGESRRESTHGKKEAQVLGMQFVLIPGNGWTPPTDEQMAQFSAIIAQQPEHTIFIHCWLGGDRTGVFLAAYRIAFEHWTPEQALQEMHQFHFKSFWHPAMRDYVRKFRDASRLRRRLRLTAQYKNLQSPFVLLLPPEFFPTLFSQYLSTFST